MVSVVFAVVAALFAVVLAIVLAVVLVARVRATRGEAAKDEELQRLRTELACANRDAAARDDAWEIRLRTKEENCRQLLQGKDEACARLLAEKDRSCAAALAAKERAVAEILAEKDAALTRKDADCRRTVEEKNAEIDRFLREKERSFAETVKGLKEQFANLAAQTLKVQSADLSQLNKNHLDAVLTPLKEQMARLQDATLKAQGESRNLGESMGKDVAAIGQIARELSGVARALSSNTRVQGRKGEEILAEKLRQAGLEENVNFFLQNGTDTDRPDVQVCDTENRWLIIDSKVSLTAYIEYVEATDEATRAAKLAAHVASVRGKIDQLAKKKYPKVFGDEHRERNYLPVTAMFVPYEAPLMEALRAEPSLWQFAAQNNVVLITPLTLLAYVRLVYLAWQHEKEARNQQAVVDTARELLARMNGFLRSFEEIGEALAKLTGVYEKAKGAIVDAPHAQTIAKSAGKLIALHVRLEGKKGKKVERAECLKDVDDDSPDEWADSKSAGSPADTADKI
ncbi:MAG: DNA recombination protein RmuC [Kiritimatiellia bacterium]